MSRGRPRIPCTTARPTSLPSASDDDPHPLAPRVPDLTPLNLFRISAEVGTSGVVAWTREERAAAAVLVSGAYDEVNRQLYASVVIELIFPRYAPRSCSAPGQ